MVCVRFRGLRDALAAGVLLVASAAPAHAQQPKSDAVVVVQVDSPGPELDAEELRAAVARELGVRTVERSESSPVRGTLRIRFTASAAGGARTTSRAIVTYTGSGGRTLERSVVLPEEPDRALEVIVLLSGNLARDEAAELVEELQRRSRASETDQEPSSEAPAEQPSAPKPPSEARTDEESQRERGEQRAAEATPSRADEQLADDGFTFNASLFHPISLHSDSDKRCVELEVGLAYGRLGALHGFGITFGFTRVDQDLDGVLMSAFYNRVGRATDGVLLTLIGNESYGDLRGFEGAGIANVRSGAVDGAQASIVFGSASGVRGAQAAGVVAHSGAGVQGFQGAIALAIAGGPVEGVQIGAVSLADGEVQGAQGAIALNFASGGLEGAQAGLVNVAPSVSGAQFGLVNIGGRVRGTQVGLVNIAESVDGLPVGVVNVVQDSRTQALAWVDTHGFSYGGVKYLHAPLYTLIALGAELRAAEGTDAHWLAADTGLGVHAQAGPWFGALDVVYSFQGLPDPPAGEDPERHFMRYRLTGGYDHEKLVGLFAGGGVEHEITGGTASFGAFGLAGIQVF